MTSVPTAKEVKAPTSVKTSAAVPATTPAAPAAAAAAAAAKQSKNIPIVEPTSPRPVIIRALPRLEKPIQLDARPIVLATHLVPSLPVSLFEAIAAVIEAATSVPVVLVVEARAERAVASDVVDMAFLPATMVWPDGDLLPVGMVFEHRLNRNHSPGVYADIVIAEDIAQSIEEILDLRGYKCAIPARTTLPAVAGLLFNHLKSKGENPSFFGNTLDSETQVGALQMVAGKQAEVGVLEAPVINCQKHSLAGVKSLVVLDSLGPIPPYQIMFNKKFPAEQRDRIRRFLLHLKPVWIEVFRVYGILGFAEYSQASYDTESFKSAVTKVPYY